MRTHSADVVRLQLKAFDTDVRAAADNSGPAAHESPLEVKTGIDMQRLVGRPHLFARFKSLREGFLLEPIGTMTLQSDGRITGYGHPNEGSWIPYAHSPSGKAESFAFVTAHNHWIPSSTWTQSMGEIPIGYFCDEPESQHALQKLCLIPHPRTEHPADVVYLIASCLAFYQRTVPALLQQLFEEGIPPERIKVVVNGCAKDSDTTIDGVEYAFSTHNAWEWSALYEAPLRWQFGYGFLIHDTNVIFPGFRRSVESFNRHLRWDHLPGNCCFGPGRRWSSATSKAMAVRVRPSGAKRWITSTPARRVSGALSPRSSCTSSFIPGPANPEKL